MVFAGRPCVSIVVLACQPLRPYNRFVVKQQVVRVDANIQWKILQAKSGEWVGVCDPLKLTVEAETWADLMEDIGHTLDALLKDLLSSNELDRFLRDQGWKLLAAIPSRPEGVRFDVPFIPAMMANANGTARQLHQ